jgi:hypothetical protein
MLYLQEHKKSAKSETFAQHIFFIRTLHRAGNGIYFEKNSNIFFQPVKFKLITD